MTDLADIWNQYRAPVPFNPASNGNGFTQPMTAEKGLPDETKGSVQGRATRAPWEPAGGGGAFDGGIGPLGGMVGLDGLLNVYIQNAEDEIPVWSIYPRWRDRELRRLWKREPIMAGAVYSMSARLKAMASEVIGSKPRNKAYYQRLFANADLGKGWGSLIGKTVIDLLTQDNGAFWELVGGGRPDKPLRGAVTGINHLDAGLCWRTFDPEYPVLYMNPYTFTYHRLHYTRVVMLSSCEQPVETARGIGLCAVSRSLLYMQIMRDIEIYKHEKVSGRFKRAIGYGTGITPKQFNQVIRDAEEDADNVGLSRYMGVPFILSQKDKVALEKLDLASIPDGFDNEKDTTLYVYALSLGFGVDAREFWPATAAGATKADAAIQHLKARGKGIGDLIQTIERALNWWVIGENAGVEFKFDYTDDEQDREVADLQQVRITNLTQMVTTGIITSQEARSLAIAQGLIDVTALDTTQNPDQADDSAPLVPNEDQASVPEDTPPPDATLDSKGIKVRASIKQDEILAETPPEPPVIQGEPLSRDQATFVSEFDADEIAALFDAFHKLPKVSKLPKPESSEPTKSVEAA